VLRTALHRLTINAHSTILTIGEPISGPIGSPTGTGEPTGSPMSMGEPMSKPVSMGEPIGNLIDQFYSFYN
jgi:hypothetical protein